MTQTLKQYLLELSLLDDYGDIKRHSKGLIKALQTSGIYGYQLDKFYLTENKPQEVILWNKKPLEIAKEICAQYSEIDDFIKMSMEKHEVKEMLKDDITSIMEIAEQIYDKMYQELDLYQYVSEQCDGYFIYNSTSDIFDALNCINELRDYEETDSALWESINMVEEMINRKATYTLINAVNSRLDEYLKKEYIPDFISELSK